MSVANYRKIYETHYGTIPKDENGRTFDIHHIDGNRENNDISNLVALSVSDHYNIHLEQGDFGACIKIKRNITLSSDELSALASKNNKKRVSEGTHNFIGGDVARNTQRRLVKEGKHHWLTGEAQRISTNNRLQAGTHPFREEWTCEHCGVKGKNKAMYNRWHNGKCKTSK